MTGWTITEGYAYDRVEVWEIIGREARAVLDDPTGVAQEMETVGDTPGAADVRDYLESGVTINAMPANEDRDPYVLLTASGGGWEREWKTQVARAFVRCLMRRVHRAGGDVCVVCA